MTRYDGKIKRKQAGSRSLNVSFSDYNFCLHSRCFVTSKKTLHFFFFLLLWEAVAARKGTFKSYIIRLFSSPAAPPSCHNFHLCVFFTPLTYCVSVSAEEITQMEEGTCQLTSSQPVCGPTVCSRWVSRNLCIRGWDCATTPTMTEGPFVVFRKSGQLCCFWHAVRHPARLPVCLPPLTQRGVAGMLMRAVLSTAIWARSEMALAMRPAHANHGHLENAAPDIGAGAECAVIAADCYLCCCTYECAVTESSISHPAKRIDNAAEGNVGGIEWSYRVSGKAVYAMIWWISDLS